MDQPEDIDPMTRETVIKQLEFIKHVQTEYTDRKRLSVKDVQQAVRDVIARKEDTVNAKTHTLTAVHPEKHQLLLRRLDRMTVEDMVL